MEEKKRFNPAEHMMKLKGKDYLQVAWRLVWFREEHPDWGIDTQLVSIEEKSAVFVCRITDWTGRQVSCGHGSESRSDFEDFLEKAETKAVGRALAMLGYGTQFAPELDEGERVVDSPIARVNPSVICEACGAEIKPTVDKKGRTMQPMDIADYGLMRFGKCLCPDCQRKANA